MQPSARLLITPGEPAGIGPDILLQAVQRPQPAEVVCIADPDLLQARARQLGLPLQILEVAIDTPPESAGAPGVLKVLPLTLPRAVKPGKPDPLNAAYLLTSLKQAAEYCRQGYFDALVTGPINKAIINDAGIAFTGHTEYLAELVGGYPVMMLAAEPLRVALATTHLPLKQVSAAITPARLTQVLQILERDLRERFGIAAPHILVCGLNPHAGEGGYLGDEEQRVIAPVLAQLRETGLRLSGPLPADTLFTPRHLQHADAVLAMYHDQGLPVLKYAGFGQAVNITLGLPIIRTSVDHGTAFELAGTGKAEAGSFTAAMAMAARLGVLANRDKPQ